jgi:hypothetical protein
MLATEKGERARLVNDPEDPPTPQFPRDKDELLRDFDVASRLRRIRDAITLRQALAPKWWETLIGGLQFGASVGLLFSVVQLPRVRHDPLATLVAFWGALALVSFVMGFEFLIFKIYHLRRANQIALEELEDLDRRLHELEKAKPDGRVGGVEDKIGKQG